MKNKYFFALVFLSLVGGNVKSQVVSGVGNGLDFGKELNEDITQRSRVAKHFKTGSTSGKAIISTGSLHYYERGKWLDIDLSIKKNVENKTEDFVFCNTTNSFKTFYPKSLNTADGIVTIMMKKELKERVISIDYENDNNEKIATLSNRFVNPSVRANTIVYSTNNQYLNVKYSQLSDSRKLDIVLSDSKVLESAPASAAFISVTEELILPIGWTVKNTETGLGIFKGVDQMVNIPQPFAIESSNDKKEYHSDSDLKQDAVYSFQLKDNVLTIVTKFYLQWLRSKDRNYPVYLDPTLNFFPQNTTYATGYQIGSTGGKSSGFIRVAAATNIGFARFELTSLASLGVTSINQAKYWGYHYTTTGVDKIVTIRGLGTVDPISGLNTAIYNEATLGPLYSNSYIFGSSAFGWRDGVLGANAGADIITAITQGWFALGFDMFTGNTTFMYQYGYDAATATDKPYLEVDYLTAPPVTVPPIASYSYSDADTIWINAATTVVNTSTNVSKSYWDIVGYNNSNKNGPFAAYPENRECKSSDGINDCFIDTTNNAVNFRYTFHQPGYYRLKLVALNKFGFDTYIDTIYIDTPSTKPIADFFADRKIVGVYDYANLFDLSSNGPTGWSWFTRPEYYNPLAPFYNTFSPSAYEQNPIFNANEGGLFDICLVASNARGSDTMCKPGYMKVISGYEVCKGTSTAKDTIAYENEGSAKLYTVGDTYIPTLIGSCSKGFTIYSCSDTVTLYIDRFKLRSNVTAGVSDSVRIRVGDVNGAIVARFGGSNVNTRSVKVPGGVAYIQTVLANNSNTPPGDSGYVIRWDAPMATYPKPTASFNMPDTVYDGYTVQFMNTSTGNKMSFAWDTNGDNVYGIDNPSSGIDSIGTNPTRTYAVFSPYKAKVCLKATNCKGSDTTCKTIQFLPVNAVPSADFTVNRTSGFTTDTFRFTDMSQNGPNDWEWTFVPNNVAFLSGTSAFSQNPIVLLNSAIAYDISLTATNQAGSNSKTKTSFVSAIAFSTPGCSGCPTSNGIPFMPSTIDVGITRVVVGIEAEGGFDTTTVLNSPIYHPLYPYKKATVYRGVSYDVSTSRGTVNEPMSTRVWIDFNRNTTFGDAPEEVIISENGQHKVVTTNTFKVPDAAPLGTTRMRIGVTYGNTSITDRVAALGCFEDFGIEVGIDRVKPVLFLIGNSIEKVELNNSYNELGVIGTDNLEEDISSRYQVYGKVDTAKLGYYILKYTVADLYGNVSDTITRTVQVEINQTGPSITLNGADTMDIEVFHSFTDPGATALSNTGSDLTPFISTTGEVDTAVLGNYVITYSITDQFGFNATKYRLVRVKDLTIPVIQTNAGTTTITHQVGLPYMDPVTVTDNYWKNVQAIRTGIINPQTPGSYNLIYDAVDGSGNHAASYFVTVVVKDLVAPEVLLKGDNPMTVDVFTIFNDPGVTATDNYYPNVYPVITGLPNMTVLGNYTMTYTVTDGAGNTTVITRVVKVVDRTAPEIQLLGGNPFEQVRFKPYVDPGVKIKDNYYSDATLQGYLEINTADLDVTRPDISIITYQVTDPSGNKSAKVSRLVNVVEVTGLKDISANNNLMVYPNPSNGLFTVTNKTTVSMESIRVVDLLGKEILNQQTTNNEVAVDLTTAPKGLYMIIVRDSNGNEQLSKIVVE